MKRDKTASRRIRPHLFKISQERQIEKIKQKEEGVMKNRCSGKEGVIKNRCSGFRVDNDVTQGENTTENTTQSALLQMIKPEELEAIFKALQDHGVTLDNLRMLVRDPEYAKRVAEFIRCSGFE